MKIHYIINDISLEKGGAQRVARHLHSGLHKQGFYSQIVSLCDPVDGLSNTIALNNKSLYSWHSFLTVREYILQYCEKDDVIHVHLFPTLLYAAIAVRLMGWKGRLVCTEHTTSNRRRSHPLGKIIDRLIYTAYQRIYCISQGTYDALKAWIPSQAHKLRIVENGVALSHMSFYERKRKEALTVVSAGRLHKQKNYETALKAIRLFIDSNEIEIEYRIAGIGDEEMPLKLLSAELGLEDNVEFCGYIDDVVAFFEQADIFLMPSLWEGFGLAAVEAMNTGLPVIAGNVAGIREILATLAPCGVLTSPDSPEEIATAIGVLADQETRFAYGREAFRRSLNYSIDSMSQAYADEYRQLARNKFS